MEVIIMDCYKAGKLICDLRKEKGLTQRMLADMLHISDRTVSKWERGAGYPDVSILHELSRVLDVNIEKILSGELGSNTPEGGNMKKVRFYVCPTCGSALWCTGGADISCCGRRLSPLIPQSEDSGHESVFSEDDDEYYIMLQHDMTKQHYISFVACAAYDRMMFLKLYPEQAAEVRFPKMYGGDLYFYCSEHGLFKRAGHLKNG